MTDNEKQAIKYFYNLRATIDESYMLFDEEINVKCGKETIKQISVVLNLIEKQQAEIEEEKKKSMHYEKLITNGLASKEIAKIDEEMQTVLRTEIEKKDKIIDEMAKTIYDYASLEVVINCPAEFDGRYNMDLCKMNAKDRNCLICIKEYFKKKVETEEK